MSLTIRHQLKWIARCLGSLILLIGISGCDSGPKTVPVKGTVAVEGGDVSVLGGHLVEGVLEGNSSVRASGVIQKDGTFNLETLLDGKVRKGAAPGKYNFRIVLSDDVDDNGKKLPNPKLARKYFEVETAGLPATVNDGPTEIQLALKNRNK